MTKDRIIFKQGEERPISEADYKHSQQPYEQQVELIHYLAGFTKIAADELVERGYTVFTERMPCYDEENDRDYMTLFTYPSAMPDTATDDEISAINVLKTAERVWDAIFSNDTCLAANAGMEFGLALAAAHAMPFEKLAIVGDKQKKNAIKSGRLRGEQQRQERQAAHKEWKLCADTIREENPGISKMETARKVRRRLKLFEEIDTISRRI